MSEAANLRSIRLQYIVIDDAPAKLRDVRTQYAEQAENPASIRRITGNVLIIDKNPINIRAVRQQYLEGSATPASVRRVTGLVMVVEKAPANIRDVRAQYLTDSKTPASIRRITSSMLFRMKDPISLRGIRAQYAEVVNDHPDFTIDPWARLVDIANQNNGTRFAPDQLTHETPETSLEPNLWNTRLKVTALPASGFSGSMYIHFQRYEIAIPFTEIPQPLLDLTGKNSVHEILTDLNALFRVNLTPEEVEDNPIIDGKIFDLVIKEGSWFFIPGSHYRYENIPELSGIYPITELDGFEM